MTPRATALAAVVTLAVAGVLPMAAPAPPSRPGGGSKPATSDPLRALIAERSTLTTKFLRWDAAYRRAGGDRNASVVLAPARGLITEVTGGHGRLWADLPGGRVEVETEGLGPRGGDVWLIENRPGSGAMPDHGDRMVRLGSLTSRGPRAGLEARLGEGFFDRFRLDLAVVTRPGKSPIESRVLLGTRPYFQRLHTRLRRAVAPAPASALPTPMAWLAALGPLPAHADASPFVVAAEGLVPMEVALGADLFFRGTFEGNGRTCGTCHPVSHNLTIDPDFIAGLPGTDPLFVGDEVTGTVPGLERTALLQGFALILENLDDPTFSNPTENFVMRSVPHVLSLATSIAAPDDGRTETQRTGWSGDGSPDGTLAMFSLGAVRQHLTKSLDRVPGLHFRDPTTVELDDMEAFMLSLGRLDDPNTGTLSLSGPAKQGQTAFFDGTTGKCRFCHGKAGANSNQLQIGTGNHNFNTGVEQAGLPAQMVEPFPLDGGHGLAPFDTDGDGVDDSFGDGTFNVPPLIEAADTGPFFHNNRAGSLVQAVDFYNSDDFNASPGGALVGTIAISGQPVLDIAAFLRVLNAAFNIEIAVQRATAAATLSHKPSTGPLPCAVDPVTGETICEDPPPDTTDTVLTLLALSAVEASDAFEVLDVQALHPTARGLLLEALDLLQQAVDAPHPAIRKQKALAAVTKLNQAEADLGSGFDFNLGEGNLLF